MRRLCGLVALTTFLWVVHHRRSPAVRAWRPGGGDRRLAGPLSVRVFGGGDRCIVLLHGITASGDVFGASYDVLGEAARVVVPDLLGFGHSMDLQRADFALDAHIAALDAMATELNLAGRPLTIAGHSLGALLGLHWAARRPEAQRVVVACAPLYVDAVEADRRIGEMGVLERLFALEGRVSCAMCAWMCRHRTLAALLVVALEPRWPVRIARAGVRHTWPAYLGAMNGVIRQGGWERALDALERRGVRVLLLDGRRDRVPVPGRAGELAAAHSNVEARMHPAADHTLPISDPRWALAACREAMSPP